MSVPHCPHRGGFPARLLSLFAALHGSCSALRTFPGTGVAPKHKYEWFKEPAPDAEQSEVKVKATIPPPGHVAVLVTGVFYRLVLPPLVDSVVKPLTAAGYKVNVFMSLVKEPAAKTTWKPGAMSRFLGDPKLANLTDDSQVEAKMRELLGDAGGNLAFFELPEKSPDVRELPDLNGPQNRADRMDLYSPYTSEVGMNVLRRFQSLSDLWQKARDVGDAGGFEHDWFMNLREDLFWVLPFDLPTLERDRAVHHTSGGTVYNILCVSYGGINDKAVILDSKAAAWMCPEQYNSFYTSDAVSLKSRNAEQYAMQLAQLGNLSVVGVPLDFMFAGSSMYQDFGSGPEVCMRNLLTNQNGCPEEMEAGDFPDLPRMCWDHALAQGADMGEEPLDEDVESTEQDTVE